MTITNPIKIVVVGGSFAGIAVINTLLSALGPSSKNIEITLIERRDARHHSLGAFRALINEEFHSQIWVPYTSLFPKDSPHKVIQGQLSEVHHGYIVLGTGQSIAFDYLTLCTGSSNPAPAKFNVDFSKEAIEITNKTREDIKKSNNIVIIGGGACGVEMSGEIKTAFPEKTVTLIHASGTLIDYPGYADKLKSTALTHLQALGVDVVLNERITIEGLDYNNAIQVAPRTIHTKAGKTIESDMQFLAVGIQVDTSYMSTLRPPENSNFDPQTIINEGTHTIKVQKTFQVVGFDHIFAVGDCSDFSKVPTAAACTYTGPTVAKNILALIEADTKNKKAKLVKGSGPPAIMCLATGPTTGVTHLPLFGAKFHNFFSRAFKSKDLMIGLSTAAMNIK
ncbi:hypothetical protein BG011_009297 [Mortierella polycephala]|uniref:FAD/NAD(P)-binding domain-containing protein n=1 Tax=Mortierella polycephala TaxID=41804 RepID=A0A9P6U7L0_9FUNG|nr:hypothetical protein BG011_009297 [Mortierella polycephala]